MNTQEQDKQQPILRDVLIPRQPIQNVDQAILRCAAEMKMAGYTEHEILGTVERVAVQCGWTWEQYNAEIISMGIAQEKKTSRLN